MNENKYNHGEVEKKWQEKWKESEIYKTDLTGNSKEKYYLLDMFPYPSGDGLHMGHTEQAAITDTFYRYKRMQGFNVMHPQGFDSFGLPAENYAIKTGIHPKETISETTGIFKGQLDNLGMAYDFTGDVVTSDPSYYKWTQFLFGKFFEHDIAYKKTAKANWCSSCNTVIANEQVEAGKCERCGTDIEQKDIPSWMFRITDFADNLIWNESNENIDWPSHTKVNQNNWIGKSSGANIDFDIVESEYMDINNNGGEDSYRDGEEETERFSAVVIVESPDGEEFLCAKWKKSDWQGFVTGGIEEGEDVGETAKREVREETGYQNPEIVKVYNQSSHGKFYHVVKERNNFSHYRIVHVKLKDLEKKDRSEEERAIADMIWVKKDEVNDFLKRGDMMYPWRVVNGDDGVDEKIKVFTTRPDTLFGATYTVLAPEHKLVQDLKDRITNWDEVEKYIKDTKKKTELERLEGKEKTGVVLQGVSAKNPANGELLPIFISDYVLAGYGTGAIMAVPAHDERDFEFAKNFNLPIIPVLIDRINIGGGDGNSITWVNLDTLSKEDLKVYASDPLFYEKANLQALERLKKEAMVINTGVLINSGSFNGALVDEAKQKITEFVGGEMTSTYRLRDWSISRQRYWGTPIPVVYSPEGGAKFVGEENLPWLLPTDVDFVPTGTAPLAKSKELLERTEKIFGKGWTPEVDTMDTFVDSSWYFLRYCDPENTAAFASAEAMKKWMPVDLYVGGAEHTYMHLLFARFFVKAMQKIGMVDFDEPFLKLRHQGMVNDIHGKKMSKSKGNVVNPDEMVERFGADATRSYMLFSSPLEDDVMWNEDNIVGVYRFLEKVWSYSGKVGEMNQSMTADEDRKVLEKLIKDVSEKIEGLKFNTAISDMMKFMKYLVQGSGDLKKGELQETRSKLISISDWKRFLKLLSPFAPHIADELAGEFLVKTDWPKFDPELAKQDTVTMGIQVNGKRRAEIELSPEAGEEEVKEKVLAMDEVQKWTEGKEIKKFIYVKGRIISVIA